MAWIIPTNVTSITQLFSGVNTMIGNNMVAYMFVITIFSVVFIASLARIEFEKALLFASWIAVMTSFFSTIIFQIDGTFVIVPLIMTLVAAFLVRRHD